MLLPPIQTAIFELNGLEAAGRVATELDAVVAAFEAALAKLEADPFPLLEGTGGDPFAAADQQAAEFGFRACTRMA